MSRIQMFKTLSHLKREAAMLHAAGDLLGLREVLDHIRRIITEFAEGRATS